MNITRILIISIFVMIITTSCQKNEAKKLSENEAMTLKPTKTVTTADSNVVGGLYIKTQEVKQMEPGLIGIYLKLENKSTKNIAPSYSFTCMNDNKTVLKQTYPMQFEDKDISNLSVLPSGGKWEGYIFFKSNDSNFILTYDDIMGHKKTFKLELKKK
jgi:hypothetical protein